MVDMLKAKRDAYLKEASELYCRAKVLESKAAVIDEVIADTRVAVEKAEEVPVDVPADEVCNDAEVVEDEKCEVAVEEKKESEIIEIRL